MSETVNLGQVNGHLVGIAFKEAIRRVIHVIREECFSFVAQAKLGYGGEMNDVKTTADKRAQAIYVRMIRECFPDFGIIAEEGEGDNEGPLIIPGKNGFFIYVTLDGLDGTKAFTRRQSYGVGTMIALVCNGVIISAWVGDVNTEEMYGFRPDSDHVHRITRLNIPETLGVESDTDLSKKYTLLRSPADKYSEAVSELLPKFKGYEVMSGSIGIWMAQLWKREVAAVFLKPGWETPWDATPIIGISKKLGYVFLRPREVAGWEEYEPMISTETYRREHETMIIHRNDLAQLSL